MLGGGYLRPPAANGPQPSADTYNPSPPYHSWFGILQGGAQSSGGVWLDAAPVVVALERSPLLVFTVVVAASERSPEHLPGHWWDVLEFIGGGFHS